MLTPTLLKLLKKATAKLISQLLIEGRMLRFFYRMNLEFSKSYPGSKLVESLRKVILIKYLTETVRKH